MKEEFIRLQRENEALRALMNMYNLGGWTDSIRVMEDKLKAEAERDEKDVEIKKLKAEIQRHNKTCPDECYPLDI